ncbi:MAG: DNA-formamidopyrimidine glycosylase [Desulfuromonadales bacterium GWD2_61_12]|nr:MAG: DNA-formamidopyrimidine glycosylase [Desulfuromonadales bacterium GWC2_61_20]OGR35198.1 MAG: DNA-formamidopyrimidine glycosylase [Desulfuromonadales bacterium GWD2_61_12]HAD04075.1 DNA-formamidopyrimidine glycosylase [Desulfuromonas sp.]HBT83543.1 DNA-formamidopyrimidine glycosylase [Desulfuromonas sp.]
MPELPEVETIRRGLEPALLGRTITQVVLRHTRLRLPLAPELKKMLPGQRVLAIERRAKYLLLRLDQGVLLFHLGMSGYLRLVRAELEVQRHDHVDLLFDDGTILRFNDARRFGLMLWLGREADGHSLLAGLGPEPWDAAMTGDYLHAVAAGRKTAIKNVIMDQKVVVGVGNIYASEALYRAGIAPQAEAGRISLPRYQRLAEAMRAVLTEAVAAGGTTLRDFRDSQGKPGYFSRQLDVYGRAGAPCHGCGRPISQRKIGGRSSFFCRHCQR